MDDVDVLERARTLGYELAERRLHGRDGWQWAGRPTGPRPHFLDRGEAVRWMQDRLRQLLLT